MSDQTQILETVRNKMSMALLGVPYTASTEGETELVDKLVGTVTDTLNEYKAILVTETEQRPPPTISDAQKKSEALGYALQLPGTLDAPKVIAAAKEFEQYLYPSEEPAT